MTGDDGKRSVKPGKHNVFCLFCRRVWAATVFQEYESKEVFNRSNLLACPWCGHHISVVERPGDKEEAVNGFAFPSREQLDRMKKELWSVSQIIRLIDIPEVIEDVIYRHAKGGRIPSVEIDNALYFRPGAADTWVQSVWSRRRQ